MQARETLVDEDEESIKTKAMEVENVKKFLEKLKRICV